MVRPFIGLNNLSIAVQSLLIGGAFALVDIIALLVIRLFQKRGRKCDPAAPLKAKWPFISASTAIMALLSAAVCAVLAFNGATIEFHGLATWAGLLLAAAISGIVPTKIWGRLEPGYLLIAIILVSELAFALVYPHFATAGIASPELRFLVAAPFGCGLTMEVSACLTYLFLGNAHGFGLSYMERLVARRFICSKKTAALSTVTFISILGVTLGVALMIVSIGILAGFERDMIDKMIGANAHLTVSAYSGYQITDYDDKITKINEHPGVVAAYPYLMGEVMVASETNLAGAMLFGLNSPEASKVINIFDKIEQGSADFLDPANTKNKKAASSPLPGITLASTAPGKVLVGAELMRILALEVGDTIRVVSPIHEELSPAGPIPKSRSFTVGGVFNTRMYEYDSKFIYIPLAAAQDFFGAEEAVSGLGIRLENAQSTTTLAPEILKSIGGYPLRINDWKLKNEALLASVELEKIVTFVVLIFIVLVASFSIVNTLTMSVIEKGQAIALFKSMGASDLMVMKIFVYQGVIIGGLGTILGAIGGIALCQLVKYFGVWLDPEVYYIDQLPVYLEAGDVVIIVISALAITFLAAVFPSRLAEHYNPVEGLRDG